MGKGALITMKAIIQVKNPEYFKDLAILEAIFNGEDVCLKDLAITLANVVDAANFDDEAMEKLAIAFKHLKKTRHFINELSAS